MDDDHPSALNEEQTLSISNPVVMVRPLILRSNRFLGNNLVNQELITLEQLEEANNHLLDKIEAEQVKEASILRILLWEMEHLKEEEFIQFQVEQFELGLVDLDHFEMPEKLLDKIDLEECWATWTVPYDFEGDFYLVATSYYMSQPVKDFWEEKLGGRVMWFIAEMAAVARFIEEAESALKKKLPTSS